MKTITLESIQDQFPSCRNCQKTIAEIAKLPDSEFKFHWNPYLKKGNLPLPYVFLGMEPSWPDKVPTKPEVGTFNTPLQFAIREFLLKDEPEAGFLITNMAQCSMRVAEAYRNRPQRYEACSEFLTQQLQWAKADKDKTCLISIGRPPKDFLDARRDLHELIFGRCKIHYLMHYSGRNRHLFGEFAAANSGAFAAFKCDLRPKYERFLETDSEFHDQQCENTEENWQRLFKWKHQMQEIEACQKSLRA